MSGVLSITRGRIRAAIRGTIYGIEGIGKTTLATQFPDDFRVFRRYVDFFARVFFEVVQQYPLSVS